MRRERLLLAMGSTLRREAVIAALGRRFAVTAVDSRWDADAALDEDPQVLVVDDILPGGRGLKVCERGRLRPDGSRRLAVLIADHDAAAVHQAMADGVIDGWIPRDAGAGTVLGRLWDLLAGLDDSTAAAHGDGAARLVGTARALFRELGSGIVDERIRGLLSQAASDVVSFVDAGTVSGFLGLLQDHHAYTFAHSLRVAVLMAAFGRHLGIAEDHVRLMAETGLAHDLGKLRIPLDVLAKPGRLDAAETAVMRTHAALGADMLADLYPDHPGLIAAVRHHHEQLAGTGYPDGLKGGQIDELSLLTAVVDVYTALTDRRDYKEAMPPAQATAVMDSMAGPHLEPRLYRRFREVVRDLEAGGVTRAA